VSGGDGDALIVVGSRDAGHCGANRGGGAQVVRAPARRPPAPASTADADTALRALAAALAPYLREVLAAEADAVILLDVARAVPLSRRVLFAACRRGELQAVKKGRNWLATREAIDTWLRLGAPHLVPPSSEDDELEPLRRSLMRPESHHRRR
jgi:hypothetical protein